MGDSLIAAMRRSGAALADSAGQQDARPNLCYGTVVSMSGSKLKVSVKGASLLLPMTTACATAKAGDRCIVETVGPQAIVTGILAR